MAEFTDEEAVAFGLLVKQVRRGMQEVNTCDEVYVFQNEDSRHGFHLWLLPRYEWMEQYGRKVESVRPILEHAQQSELTDILINEVKKQATKLQQYLQTVQ